MLFFNRYKRLEPAQHSYGLFGIGPGGLDLHLGSNMFWRVFRDVAAIDE